MSGATVSVYFTEQQLELIDRLAHEWGVSRERAVADAVEAEFSEHKNPPHAHRDDKKETTR